MFDVSNVKKTFDEFWKTSPTGSETSMYGLADIWEGPSRDGSPYSAWTGASTVLAIETYKDNVYILQGGHNTSWLKVVTPNGQRMYELICFSSKLSDIHIH